MSLLFLALALNLLALVLTSVMLSAGGVPKPLRRRRGSLKHVYTLLVIALAAGFALSVFADNRRILAIELGERNDTGVTGAAHTVHYP